MSSSKKFSRRKSIRSTSGKVPHGAVPLPASLEGPNLPSVGFGAEEAGSFRRPSLLQPKKDTVLGDEIRVLEAEGFNADAFMQKKCQTMSEKSIRRMCNELFEHKRMSAEEMRKSVYANYAAFIKTAKEISGLESELQAMRTLLLAQSSLIRSAGERTSIVSPQPKVASDPSVLEEDRTLSKQEQELLSLPDRMSVCLSERKVEEALELLKRGEDSLAACRREVGKGSLLRGDEVEELEAALKEQRLEISDLLAATTLQPSVSRSEIRAAVASLTRLGEGKRAHTLLLKSHSDRVRLRVGPMRPSGVSYGGSYTAAVSRTIFSSILQAAKDSASVFGESAACTSELVLWAHGETEWCAALMLRYVLSSAAAAGGLRLAAECVQIAMGHCALLEDQGLAMAPVLLRLVRPSVEQALEANIRRIEESVNAMAAADSWSLQSVPLATKTVAGSGKLGGVILSVAPFKLTSSALRLYSMVQDFLDDVVPIVNMQLTTPTLDGLAHLFKQFVAILNKARCPEEMAMGGEEWVGEGGDAGSVPTSMSLAMSMSMSMSGSGGGGGGSGGDDDGGGGGSGGAAVNRAVSDVQQLALIANAVVLSEELPRLAAKLTSPGGGTGGRESARVNREQRRSSGGESKRQQLQQWKKQLSEGVESLRMAYCLQRATELLYPDVCQEDAILPNLYFLMDQYESDPALWLEEPLPSEPIQNFLFATMSISDAASEVLTSRDRLVLQLLTQFGLALLTLVCHDKSWEDPNFFVGPTGLQQFLLDIHFLKAVAAKYHFTSRQLQTVADTSMERARETFDPNGECPGDAQMIEIAQDCLTTLLQHSASTGRL